MPHSLHVSGLLPSISSHPKKQATHQINKYAKLAWFLAWPRCFYGRSTCCSWWSILFSARRAMAAWVSSLVGQSLQAFHLSSLLELQWGSTKWLSSNCCQILRFVGPTQRMKKHHWVHGLDETGCNVWNSVLIGDLLPSSMFTFLDAGIFTFLLADVFSCSKARKCTIQVALWLAKLVKVICIYTHEWIHLIAY